VGSSVVKKTKMHQGYKNIITVTREKLDLRNQKKFLIFLKKIKLMQLLMPQELWEEFMQIINIKQILFTTT
jgi:hypothetical protein